MSTSSINANGQNGAEHTTSSNLKDNNILENSKGDSDMNQANDFKDNPENEDYNNAIRDPAQNEDEKIPYEEEKRVSRFREVLPQFVAHSMVNLVSLDLSLIMNFSTVLIADLHHAEGPMSLDDTSASWIGSMAYICQPMGSLMSGVLVEKLGRKGGLLAINVPYLIAWIIFWTAPNITMLLVANLVTGVTVGLSEAPLVNYGGEMAQPNIRGTVTASGSIFYQLGIVADYLLLALTDWRTTAAICTSVPVISFLVVLFAPETPPYLVSRGRIKEAEKSLCWLRGWVKPSAVQKELQELISIHYVKPSSQLRETKADLPEEARSELLIKEPLEDQKKQSIPRRVLRSVLELFEPPTLRPLMLILPMFVSSNLTGMTSIRPYIVRVFREFRPPMEAEWMSVMASVSNIIASLILIFIIRMAGKRPLFLLFTASNAITAILLGTYAFMYHDDGQESWIPVLLFLVLSFSSTFVAHLPWIFLCEVFPFRTRGLASGLCAAWVYLTVFTTNKTYLGMEKTIGLHGSFWFFGVVNGVALVYCYYTLLETEGKSLHEIERHFQQRFFLKSSSKKHTP